MPIRKKGGGLIRATFEGGLTDWFENSPESTGGGRRHKSRRKKTKKYKRRVKSRRVRTRRRRRKYRRRRR